MTPTESPAAPATVTDLVARRAQLQEWLERLDEASAEVPPHVADRVRADYQERLSAVLDELAQHADALQSEAAGVERELDAAEREHTAASDSLEEMRLRHRIGELSDEEWDGRRAALEAGVRTAAETRDAWAAELGRLRTLLADVGAAAPASRVLLPGLLFEGTDEEAGAPDADDLSDADATVLLEDLDGELGGDPADGPTHVLTEAELQDRKPRPGVKCPDCGYTNDPSAWYCGVCGVDLN